MLLLLGSISEACAQARAAGVSVQISRRSAAATAGDWVEFTTTLQNEGANVTPPLTVHLSIAPLAEEREVDPEDWSAHRTRFLSPLQPGESIELSWKLHALLEGSFAIFVSAISPEPSVPSSVSAALRLQVAPDDILPLDAVIPVVAIVPLLPLTLLIASLLQARRARRPRSSDEAHHHNGSS
jgi:hypothetical protein